MPKGGAGHFKPKKEVIKFEIDQNPFNRDIWTIEMYVDGEKKLEQTLFTTSFLPQSLRVKLACRKLRKCWENLK